ncbi:protein YhfH [Paenibacillus solanacearum]|uniref:protein YhfH n=1 Tax=Paenibacillus solanacearum TaxID=2048548 RepID=UPI001FEB4B02|nr:protein YhfH [Paenibacillus solanacearum]
MRSSDFYDSLPPRCCDTCGELMEELADCYVCTCTTCRGVTFYSLSPAVQREPASAPAAGPPAAPSASRACP